MSNVDAHVQRLRRLSWTGIANVLQEGRQRYFERTIELDNVAVKAALLHDVDLLQTQGRAHGP